jgi:hypothetical protein
VRILSERGAEAGPGEVPGQHTDHVAEQRLPPGRPLARPAGAAGGAGAGVGRILCGGRTREDNTATADHTPQLSHRYLTNDLMCFMKINY